MLCALVRREDMHSCPKDLNEKRNKMDEVKNNGRSQYSIRSANTASYNESCGRSFGDFEYNLYGTNSGGENLFQLRTGISHSQFSSWSVKTV